MEQAYQDWIKKQDQPSLVTALDKFKPVIDTAMRTYVGADDVAARSHAKLLTIKAMRSYDASKGTKLRTHMLTQMQPLRRFASKRRSPINIPERVQQQLGALYSAGKELQDSLDREPSDTELADHTGFSVDRIRKIRQQQLHTIAESGFTTPTGDQAQPAVSKAIKADAWADYVYSDLSSVDKKIFEWRTGYGGAGRLTNNEIAKRLRLTPGAVTQRSSRIAQLLNQGAHRGRGNL